ncbi:MAG: hypothetical protein ACE5JS_13690 [Nitrospinota bacterium]
MRPGRVRLSLILSVFALGLLIGCGRSQKGPAPDPLAALLPDVPRHQALILLRTHLPKVVTCPSTIEMTENAVSWVDIHSCHPTDLRRRLRFRDIQATRLIREKVHMGFDQRWLDVLHNGSWIPVGRGVGRGLGREARMLALEGVKAALERLSPGRETPHEWKVQPRPFLF